MAAHVRTQVREAIAALVTGLPTTEARVYQSRVYPLEEADLPALLVFAQSEPVQAMTIHYPVTQSRRLSISIKAVVAALVDLDDTLDQICKEVEVALSTGTLEPLARNVALTGTEIEMAGNAEQPKGEATMTFEVEYMTAEDAPDVAL